MLEQTVATLTYSRLKNPPLATVWERFCAKIVVTAAQCWEWQGARSHGYGQFHLNGAPTRAHVIVMIWLDGDIPEGMVVDHFSCDNRSCVNPDHLKVVSHRANVLRSNSATGLQSRKIECVKGHPLSGNNVYIDGKGRRCRTCKREYNKAYGKTRSRKGGKREPIKISAELEKMIANVTFASVRQTMINPPDLKTWLRFIKLVNLDPSSSCWLFQGSKVNGYGQFSLGEKTLKPHRMIRIWIDGVIPEGYDVHHKCYHTECVNPEHLESVPPRINILDSENTRAGRNARKTHCPKKHPFEGKNLMISNGRRLCRTCHNLRSKNNPVEAKRKNALTYYNKNSQDPAFKERMRNRSAEYRRLNPERVQATEAKRREKKMAAVALSGDSRSAAVSPAALA